MLKRIVILTMVISVNLFGFSALNQRNHPEIKWKKIESDHIVVVYHDPLYDTALEAAKISEATYESLVKTYGIDLSKKIQIFITNQDDITNGYSAAGKYIAIWVDVNEYINIFTGREKWLRKVLSHEISHHFVFHSIKSWVDIFFPVTAIGFPSDFNEGYAMFFSGEEWGYGREDASLRKGVFSNDLSYEHPDGFFYTTGFSMVRYLYEFYGMEKMQELLKYRNKAKIYSFKTAFKKVYHKSVIEFKEEWRRYIYTYYFGTAYEMKSAYSDTSSFNSIEKVNKIAIKGWKDIRTAVMKDSLIFFLGKGCEKQKYYDLAIGYFYPDTLTLDTLEIRKIKLIEPVTSVRDMSISNDLNYCGYVKYERAEHGSIIPMIYQYDLKKNEKRKVVTGRMPVFLEDGSVIFQTQDHDGNYLKKHSNGQTEKLLEYNSKTSLGHFVLSPDADKFALVVFDENAEFYLNIYDLKDFKLLNHEVLDQFPRYLFWQDNENLIVTIPTNFDSRTAIKRYHIYEKKWIEFNTPPYNIVAVNIEKTDSTQKAIGWAQLDREKSTLAKIDMQKTDSCLYQPNLNYYSRWIHTKYPNEIVVSDSTPELTEMKYSHIKNLDSYLNFIWPDMESALLMTLWMDPLMKHMLLFTGIMEYDSGKPYLIANYTNRCFGPTINFDYTKYFWTGGIQEDTWYFYDIERFGMNLSYPMDWLKNPFVRMNFISGINYQDVKLRDDKISFSPIFENGSAITSETMINFYYNLPYRNSFIHPVRKCSISYQLSMANSKLGMNKDFSEHEFNLGVSFAPLYNTFKQRIDLLTFTNKTNFNFVNGKYFSQYMPGLDINENIPIGNGLITERHYLRGIEKTLVGEKLLITKNEVWCKIADDMNISLNVAVPLIDLQYLGVGIWSDYGKIWVKGQEFDYQTAGYEIKGFVTILGIPTIQRFGRAYNLDSEKLSNYYQVNIPIDYGF